MKEFKGSKAEDIIIHCGENSCDFLGSVTVPIYQSSLFSRKNGATRYTYTRINNPTTEAVERKLAELEKAEDALLFSSGMGAITAALMRYVKTGTRIAAVKNVYLPVEEFLNVYLKEKFDVRATYFEAGDFDDFLRAVGDGVDIIYLETIVSNVFTVPDLERICSYAREHDIKVIVDNTYATPVFCNPLEYGADIVVHSCSKYINGHSDLVAGAAMADSETISEMRHWERGAFGAVIDPHQAWLLLRGMRTLTLRMEQHMKNGLALARFLENHPKIEKVIYPALESHPQHETAVRFMRGFPGLFCFVPAGGRKNAERFYYSLNVPEVGPSWGGFETIMNAPGLNITEERSALTGILPGQIRISVGLESIDAIIEDFKEALDKYEF
ncbi:MAG TPA: aminotransferase class I/II-fold pyridoxal phosphate-dependent enzyme [Clostridia bacterium]|nr:aminotransferase class I/II-fold pyridoxal phosphate-dependent enzyme [Clostridia bacterium]